MKKRKLKWKDIMNDWCEREKKSVREENEKMK